MNRLSRRSRGVPLTPAEEAQLNSILPVNGSAVNRDKEQASQ
jgi:hypothetical protein